MPAPSDRARGISTKHLKYVVLLAAVVVVALVGPLAGMVGDVEDNGPTSQLPRGAQSTQVEEALPAFDASGVLPVVIVAERPGGLTAGDRSWLAALEEEAAKWAVGPATVDDSTDGQATTLTYPINTLTDDWPDAIVATRNALEDAPAGMAAHVTGPAAGAYDGFSVFDGLTPHPARVTVGGDRAVAADLSQSGSLAVAGRVDQRRDGAQPGRHLSARQARRSPG